MSVGEDHEALTKVLIVDDSRMVRASLIKHIRGRFEFREEADGDAAWQALVVDPTIELVLTDIGMPQLDGFGLLARIRQSRLARLQHMPVVIISGDEDDEARDRAHKLGANDFITKGIGHTELLARLESLCRLTRTRRELEESRAALARQSPVDPATGLATQSYLDWKGAQELALARRHEGGISAMVVEIDHFDDLSVRHGHNVPQLVARKLSKILATKIRQEDTVAELAPGRFAVLSPLSDSLACSAFALRMQKAIEKLVMTYRDERIRISVTIGVASSAVDGTQTVSELIDAAVRRVNAGQSAGGNRVVSDQGEINQAMLDRMSGQFVSIDHMLMRLRLGDERESIDRLPAVIASLLPLLELIESHTHCGIPLDTLRERAKEAPASRDGDAT